MTTAFAAAQIEPELAVLRSEAELAGLALSLTDLREARLSLHERTLAARAVSPARVLVEATQRALERGEDPLGDAFCALRSLAKRRERGAVYTPEPIVAAMLARVSHDDPRRVVDLGAGSGRFTLAAARRFSGATLVPVENDPLALLLLRANLSARGLAGRAHVVADDYRTLKLPQIAAKTLFIGNPPYVRHHLVSASHKQWLTARARELGLSASQLAGLHAHFLLATALHAAPGDVGVLVTSAEWLDVRYGSLVRELLIGPLGLLDLHVLAPSAAAFPGVETTAAILCFEVGARPATVRVRHVSSLAKLAPLSGGRAVPRERLAATPRWSGFLHARPLRTSNAPELGEFFAVHRGQVTGANHVWIAGEHSRGLPASVLFPSVTRARELIRAGVVLASSNELRCVIDLPPDLDVLPVAERRKVQRFLAVASRMGAEQGFVAQHRKAWWSVGLRAAAPLLVTYMARRPPAFVHNVAGARHLNIAHGLYPRTNLSPASLLRIARHLSEHTPQSSGRTYAGGLTKFEPGELLRLRIPGIAELVTTA